jgi:hypothetical protein
MSRRHDVRRAKRHLTYTIAEIAKTFDVNVWTVSQWIKAGLKPIDGRRPYLFSGSEIASFLERRNKPRQPLGPGEIFCVACKRPTTPVANLVYICPRGPTTVDVIGACEVCDHAIYRRTRRADLQEKFGGLHLWYENGDVPLAPISSTPHTPDNQEDAP